MKLSLSKKDDPRGLHVVLSCEDREEAWKVQPVITEEILKHKANPVREILSSGKVLYRFHIRYLEQLGLAFPMADYSTGIHARLRRAEEKRIADMPVPKIRIPGFNGKLYDFQKIATGKIIDGEIDFLNDEMGLGKTFSSLAAIRCLDAFPALWICPNGTKFTTAEVAEEFFGIKTVVIDGQQQTKAQRQALIEARAPLTIVNFEAIRAKPIRTHGTRGSIIGYEYANPALFDYPYSFAVVDEHHRVKTPDAQVTYGFFELLAEQWLCMSGTPILNRPEEIWTVLHKIYPERFPNYEEFLNWIAIRPNGYVVGYRPEPMAELKEFLASVTLRRRKDQVLKDLPKVLHVPRYIDLNPEQNRLYMEIQEEFKLRMEDGSVKSIAGALPQITRLKQACFSPELYGGSQTSSKISELKLIVEELVASGEKAIIFSQWSKATRILQRELAEYNPAYVTGEVKKLSDRHAQQKKFKEDDTCKLYIGTIGANREGINLGNATYVIYTDKGWTPAEQDQSTGRSAAGGLRGVNIPKGTKVHVIELRARDTIEEWIEDLLKKKAALFDRMIERDGGKKIERVTVRNIADLLRR